jgi:hypothetical protein
MRNTTIVGPSSGAGHEKSRGIRLRHRNQGMKNGTRFSLHCPAHGFCTIPFTIIPFTRSACKSVDIAGFPAVYLTKVQLPLKLLKILALLWISL